MKKTIIRQSTPKIVASILCIFFCSSALPEAVSKEQGSFNQAYRSYKAAVEVGDKKEQLRYARRAYKAGQKIFATDSESLTGLRHNLANALFDAVEVEESLKVYEQVLAQYIDLYGEVSEKVMLLYLDIARGKLIDLTLSPRQRIEAAKVYIDKSIDVAERLHGMPSMEYAEIQLAGADLLGVYKTREDFTKSYLDEAYATFVGLTGEKSVSVGLVNYKIGEAYLHGNRKPEDGSLAVRKAQEYFKRALLSFPDDNPNFQRWRSEVIKSLNSSKAMLQKAEALKQTCVNTQSEMASGAISAGGEIRPVVRVEPIYPIEAARKEIEGGILLEYDIDILGYPKNIEALEGKNFEIFADAAMRSVKKWKYKPRCNESGPVDVFDVRTYLTFELH